MKILSIECSTRCASLATLDGDHLLAQASWSEDRARHEGLYTFLCPLLARSGWTWRDIEVVAVGRGPGAYSGLRVSILAAQALAAPSGTPVVAASSMEALGRDWLARHEGHRHEGHRISVVGDARRDSFWVGHIEVGASASTSTQWKIIRLGEAALELAHSHAILTPHPDRLAPLRALTPTLPWVDGEQVPTAEQVARLALARLRAGAATDSMSPLYLHAAV